MFNYILRYLERIQTTAQSFALTGHAQTLGDLLADHKRRTDAMLNHKEEPKIIPPADLKSKELAHWYMENAGFLPANWVLRPPVVPRIKPLDNAWEYIDWGKPIATRNGHPAKFLGAFKSKDGERFIVLGVDSQGYCYPIHCDIFGKGVGNYQGLEVKNTPEKKTVHIAVWYRPKAQAVVCQHFYTFEEFKQRSLQLSTKKYYLVHFKVMEVYEGVEEIQAYR